MQLLRAYYSRGRTKPSQMAKMSPVLPTAPITAPWPGPPLIGKALPTHLSI